MSHNTAMTDGSIPKWPMSQYRGKQRHYVCLSFIDRCHSFFENDSPAELNESDSTVSGLPVTLDLHYCLKCQWTIFQPLVATYTLIRRVASWSQKGIWIDCCPCPPPPTSTHIPLPMFTPPTSTQSLPPPPHPYLLLPSRSTSAMQVEAWPKIWGDEWLHLADASSPKCVCVCVCLCVFVCVCVSEPLPSLLCCFLSQLIVLIFYIQTDYLLKWNSLTTTSITKLL